LIWARLFGGEVAAITVSLLFGREAIVEPFDKLLSFLIVYLIVRFFPQRLIMYFPNMRPSPDSGLEG
jgi:hypothetical protein